MFIGENHGKRRHRKVKETVPLEKLEKEKKNKTSWWKNQNKTTNRKSPL